MAQPRDDLAAQIEPGNFSPDYRAERVNLGPADILAQQNASHMGSTQRVPVKLTAPDANYTAKGPKPFVCGNCRYAVYGDEEWGCTEVMGSISPDGTCRLFLPKPTYTQRSERVPVNREAADGGHGQRG